MSQHIKVDHPSHWQGDIYSSLPADFDYGDGPLEPARRAGLIQYCEYAQRSYRKGRIKRGLKVKRGPYNRTNGVVDRVAYRRKEPVGGTVDRAIRYCPHCGWNLDAMQKAQSFIDGGGQ
jgi:hypothetical protein